MRRPRPRRMDFAIDHLAEYGFARSQIRRTINDLLQVYGRDGWVFLEDKSYHVVIDKLLEEQAEQEHQDEDGSTITDE